MKTEVAQNPKSYLQQYRSSLNELRSALSQQKYHGGSASKAGNMSSSYGAVMGRHGEFENKVQQRGIFNYQERPVQDPQIMSHKRSSKAEGIENQIEKMRTQAHDIGKSAYKLPAKSLKDNYINFQQSSSSSKAQSRSQTPGSHLNQVQQKRYQAPSSHEKVNTLNLVEKHLSQLREIQNITGTQQNSNKLIPKHSSTLRDQRPPMNRMSANRRLKTQTSSKSFSSISSQKTTVSSHKENEQIPTTSSNEEPSNTNTYSLDTQSTSRQNSNYQKTDERQLQSFKVVGLKNLGNTCFMNSILQCVFATPCLTKFFLNGAFEKQYSSAPRSQALAKSYYLLLSKIYSSSSHILIPSELKYVMGKKNSQFLGYSQQDAQEFLRCFIDAMHEELNRVTQKPPYKEIDFEKLPWADQGDGWWNYNKHREDSIIGDIFEGQLMSKIQCQLCGYASLAFDNFMDLSIPIPKRRKLITLNDCLEDFIFDEPMEKCGYKCKKCQREDNFRKQMTVWRFPKVMVIHLKRFQNTYLRREKLSTPIDIPSQIDLQHLAPHSNHKSKKNALYELYAISHHSGSLNGGHYVADVKGPDDRWYRCNDSAISRISSGDRKETTSAYVLFYQRRKEQVEVDELKNKTKL